MEVVNHGDRVDPAPPKERALLALLALNLNRVVSVDRIIDGLWGDAAPDSVATAIQVYVSALRRVLEPTRERRSRSEVLLTSPPGYMLCGEPADVDVTQFEALTAEGRAALTAGAHDVAAVLLYDALALWRGPAFADIVAPFTAPEVTRLDAMRLSVLADRIDADLALGRHDEILPELAGLTAEHPYDERLRAQHLLALYRAGRQAEALAAYQQTRELLVEELGIDPGSALQRLSEAILRQDDSLAAPQRPTAESRRARPLPVDVSGFVGRRQEVADLAEALRHHRLITVVAAGGMGKTRLVLHVAAAEAVQFSGGVAFADLAAVHSDREVVSAACAALGFREVGLPALVESAAASIEATLLVLDSCEHVTAEVATLAAALTRGCRHLTVLATSREPLRLPGELAWRLGPLSLPEFDGVDAAQDSDAVALFVDLAGQSKPGFRLTNETVVDVKTICRRLDGMPLALELAAARLRALSLRDVAARLQQRFALLSSGGGGALARHQTLRATLDWSYDLLSPEEQRVFRRLAIFSGGFTLAAALRVAADESSPDEVLDAVTSLVDKSLVVAEDRGTGVGYRLLHIVRDYGRDLILAGGEGSAAVRWRAAAETSPTQSGEMSLYAYAGFVSPSEGERTVEFSHSQAAGIGQSGDLASHAQGLYARACLARQRGADEHAESLAAESLALHRSLGDPWGMARVVTLLARLVSARGDTATAIQHAAGAADLFEQVGDEDRRREMLRFLEDLRSSPR